jgi:hypothetical protein
MQKRLLKLLIASLILCTHVGIMEAQEVSPKLESRLARKELNKIRPSYLAAGNLTGIMKLRDTGTSPLFFQGLTTGAAFSLFSEDSLKLSHFYADISLMSLDDSGDPYPAVWTGGAFAIGGGTIWKLKATRNSKINVGVGYSFRTFTTLRQSDDFRNAGFGLDHISSAGFAGGLFFPFERKNAAEKKIWFLKIKSNPRKYSLSYQVHVPLINVTMQPEYAYLTDVIVPEKNSFDTYGVNLGGYLVTMETLFTYYLYNGNAFRLKYGWTAMASGDTFQLNVAQHTIGTQLLLRFNTKNRDERY